MRRKLDKRKCGCGKDGTYWYSRELCECLGVDLWTGIFLCDECYEEIEEKWKKLQSSEA